MNIDNLIFDYGWRKPINLTFENKKVNIELVFNAYDDEQVSAEQMNAYEDFIKNQNRYENKVNELLSDFVAQNQINDYDIKAKTLYFNRDGEFALLCDCSWDIEHGIAIILSPKQLVITQDDFL